MLHSHLHLLARWCDGFPHGGPPRYVGGKQWWCVVVCGAVALLAWLASSLIFDVRIRLHTQQGKSSGNFALKMTADRLISGRVHGVRVMAVCGVRARRGGRSSAGGGR
eukprot:COSAG01_NODE_4189_length_5250_cov_12.234735_5_plen_108_part_00